MFTSPCAFKDDVPNSEPSERLRVPATVKMLPSTFKLAACVKLFNVSGSLRFTTQGPATTVVPPLWTKVPPLKSNSEFASKIKLPTVEVNVPPLTVRFPTVKSPDPPANPPLLRVKVPAAVVAFVAVQTPEPLKLKLP